MLSEEGLCEAGSELQNRRRQNILLDDELARTLVIFVGHTTCIERLCGRG